jgi:hypothetical protein
MSGFTSAAGISPTTVTTSAQAPLGFELVQPDGDKGLKVWVYVFNDEAATDFTEGALVQRDAAASTYDAIVSTGAVSPQRIIGVAQHTIAAGSYGFVLKRGIGKILCDGNVTANSAVCPDASAATATDVAAVTDAAVAVALADDTGAATKVDAMIMCVG